jgi:NADP-dependent 3-hydroxy acid dehydrogenase YdfG
VQHWPEIHEKLTKSSPQKWQQIIKSNLWGILRMVCAFTPGILEQGRRGDVVFLSSVIGRQRYPYRDAATKTAIEEVADTIFYTLSLPLEV